jgi:hypothetical protein
MQVLGHAEPRPLHKKGAQVGLPGEPSGTAAQLPSLPAMLQALQLAPHAWLQQNPSTQLLLAHSAPATHVSPMGFWPTHMPPLQKPPDWQSALLAHMLRQALPAALHW